MVQWCYFFEINIENQYNRPTAEIAVNWFLVVNFCNHILNFNLVHYCPSPKLRLEIYKSNVLLILACVLVYTSEECAFRRNHVTSDARKGQNTQSYASPTDCVTYNFSSCPPCLWFTRGTLTTRRSANINMDFQRVRAINPDIREAPCQKCLLTIYRY